jgi:hypothetical protein
MTNPEYFKDKMEEFSLDCERYCVLGKKILLATTLFESSLALLIHAEGEAIDTITDALQLCENVSLPELVDYNEATKELICCLAKIKEGIVKEIEIGNRIANTECDPCPCNLH